MTKIILLSAAALLVSGCANARAPIAVQGDIAMQITSPAFEHNQTIPPQYTCDGDGISPPLKISGVPESAQSLVLIMDDPDIPDFVKQRMDIDVFDHWIAFNIPPETKEIPAAAEPSGTAGINSTQKTGYTGPCPPDKQHRYLFKLYALDATLDLEPSAKKQDIENAMKNHVLEQAVLVGLYARQ